MANSPVQIHGAAVAVAIDHDGPLAGALILGPSGAGKSALALSLIEACPWRRTALVADDVVLASQRDGALWARAPDRISGVIEVRGFGPARIRAIREAPLLAAFDLGLAGERLPEPRMRILGGSARIALWPFAAGGDAPARLRVILRSILGGQIGALALHSSPDTPSREPQ